MLEWMQFAVIAVIILVEDLAHEIKVTWHVIRDLFRYRLRWLVTEKLQLMFSKKR